MTKKHNILVFTGAGVSAESGVPTFRDNGGLWGDYDVNEVASISGWKKNPQKVLDFYNMRRSKMSSVNPNEAHFSIAHLEKYFNVTVVTQNVDDLHERAGSTDVIHLHGEMSKLRSEYNCEITKDYTEDVKLGDLCSEGGQWRPDIVWFGEDLDSNKMFSAKTAAEKADTCIIVGTSLQVYPAYTIPFLTKETTQIFYVDPGELNLKMSNYRRIFFDHVQKIASEGMKDVWTDLISMYKIDI